MKISEFSYKEYDKKPNEWALNQFRLNTINLVVGKNATGKSRTLNVISGLAKILNSPQIPFENGSYYASFDFDSVIYDYKIEIDQKIIKKEELSIGGDVYITRIEDGSGTIKNSEKDAPTKFKIPQNQPIVLRRDEVQYPYLENLYKWASTLKQFKFTKTDEDQHSFITADANSIVKQEINFDELTKAISIFYRGKTDFPAFVQDIIADMNNIGFDIEGIELGKIENLRIIDPLVSIELQGLIIKEGGLEGKFSQISMSDGMFRALAILINFNYIKYYKKIKTVVIDDIGEGLDFERSTKLIKLLMAKTLETDIQLIMSTNDRFVMNSTDLEYWQVISRKKNIVNIFNTYNSKDKFEQFRFTGLNNFELFSNNFLEEVDLGF